MNNINKLGGIEKKLEHLWLDACKANPGRIVFPEATDLRTLEAIARLVRDKAAREIFVVGDRQSSIRAASANQILCRELESGVIWTGDKIPDLAKQTQQIIEKNAAHRGKVLDPANAEALSKDPLFQAGAMIGAGLADCALAGAVSNTAAVIRAALGTTGLAHGLKTVSGSFIMERAASNGTSAAAFLYADAGVVIEPSVEQLVDIATASVHTWRNLVPGCGFEASGREPVVAFLSFSTKGSAKHPAAEKMSAAAKLFHARHPDVATDGELQFDAALIPEIAARKCPESAAAGRANVFIFPDLGAGNIAYKITERLAGFHAYGPILQGLANPYSDLSRGASSHDIFMSALLNLLRV